MFRVVALTVGEPSAADLWTLRTLRDTGVELAVVRARRGRSVRAHLRLRRLVRDHGLPAVTSRLLAARVFGAWEGTRQRDRLDLLFDGDALRDWWGTAGIPVHEVSTLNAPDAHAAIAALAPDILVRVSGGLLGEKTYSLAHIATLNIHHGMAPDIRGMWSIPWALIEGRPDWIGATVHVVDSGIDTGAVLWRGGPQLGLGDTATTLFFRAHLEAVQALAGLVRDAAAGRAWQPVEVPAGTPSTYRSAPGIMDWIRFLWLRRGRLAPITLETGRR